MSSSPVSNPSPANGAVPSPDAAATLDTTLLESLFYNEMMMLDDSSELLSSVTAMANSGETTASLDESNDHKLEPNAAARVESSSSKSEGSSDDPLTFAEQTLLTEFGVSDDSFPHISDGKKAGDDCSQNVQPQGASPPPPGHANLQPQTSSGHYHPQNGFTPQGQYHDGANQYNQSNNTKTQPQQYQHAPIQPKPIAQPRIGKGIKHSVLPRSTSAPQVAPPPTEPLSTSQSQPQPASIPNPILQPTTSQIPIAAPHSQHPPPPQQQYQASPPQSTQYSQNHPPPPQYPQQHTTPPQHHPHHPHYAPPPAHPPQHPHTHGTHIQTHPSTYHHPGSTAPPLVPVPAPGPGHQQQSAFGPPPPHVTATGHPSHAVSAPYPGQPAPPAGTSPVAAPVGHSHPHHPHPHHPGPHPPPHARHHPHHGHPHYAHHGYPHPQHPPSKDQLVSQFATLAGRLGINLPPHLLSSITESAGIMSSAGANNKTGDDASHYAAAPGLPLAYASNAPNTSGPATKNGGIQQHSSAASNDNPAQGASASSSSALDATEALRKTAEEAIAAVTRKRSRDESDNGFRRSSANSQSSMEQGSKSAYAKRRKKPRLSDCEQRLAQLRAENETLKRHLDNVTNQTEKFEQDRLKAEATMVEMLQNDNASDEELNNVLREYSEAYSDYGKRREEELTFHLEQLQKLANPTNFTKMGLWTIAKANDSKDLSKQNPLIGILQKELNITPQQVRKILEQRQKIRDLCNNLNTSLVLLKNLKDLCGQKNKTFHDRMAKTQEILRPKQVVKLIMWIKDHSDVLETICPGWSTEQVVKRKAPPAIYTNPPSNPSTSKASPAEAVAATPQPPMSSTTLSVSQPPSIGSGSGEPDKAKAN